jgi:hypothetical protein
LKKCCHLFSPVADERYAFCELDQEGRTRLQSFAELNHVKVDLVLLRHKFLRPRTIARVLQYGHRDKSFTSASMIRMRMVAIESGMCRSGRKGGSSGSVTVGKGRFLEQSGGTRS